MISNNEVKIGFTPHGVNMARGILITSHDRLLVERLHLLRDVPGQEASLPNGAAGGYFLNLDLKSRPTCAIWHIDFERRDDDYVRHWRREHLHDH
jgi:hypothetical protein